ncbi:hypothetical protein SteCoe_38721 [Stentor coeruleus]|uniref:Uncharacterized protein n=1 Tax=Stentor coeruleus TaxID=5963 RepID=A0A1R2AL48_9CILI|nr:hypothetical protein SteCoe_38721 [Stentor coeruleus]
MISIEFVALKLNRAREVRISIVYNEISEILFMDPNTSIDFEIDWRNVNNPIKFSYHIFDRISQIGEGLVDLSNILYLFDKNILRDHPMVFLMNEKFPEYEITLKIILRCPKSRISYMENVKNYIKSNIIKNVVLDQNNLFENIETSVSSIVDNQISNEPTPGKTSALLLCLYNKICFYFACSKAGHVSTDMEVYDYNRNRIYRK